MNRLPISHLSWLLPGLACLKARNGNVRQILARANISPALIQRGDGWITKHQLYAFYHEAAFRSGGADFGLSAGSAVTASRLGPVGASMAGAATFGEALRTFCRLTPRHVESIGIWVEDDAERPEEVWFCTRTDDWSPGLSETAEYVALGAMINVVRIVGGTDWTPRRARLQAEANPDAESHPTLDGCAVRHGQPHKAIAFPASFLGRPLPSRDGAGDASSPVLLPENDQTVSHRIELLVQSILEAGEILPGYEGVAWLAGMRPRTLHRRLAEDGVTLREIADRLRLKQARFLLCNSDISVKEVAHHLGYSGPNNFIRAFRRLTGMTPGEFARWEDSKPSRSA